MKAVMVTGATGFVGRCLIDALLTDESLRLLCLGRSQRRLNELETKGRGRIRTLLKPVEDLSANDAPFPTDCVIHLASSIDAPSADEMRRINVQGTERVLKWALANKARHLIFISTSYARDPDPANHYGMTKHEAEQLVAQSGLPFTILRPSIIYGPGDTRNFGNIIRLASVLPIIPVFGEGVKLQPLYVDDLAAAIKKTAMNPLSMNKTYEIGGAEQVTLAQWVRLYLQVNNQSRTVVTVPSGLLSLIVSLAERILPSPPLNSAKLQRWSAMPGSDSSAILKDLELSLTPLAEGLKHL